MTKVNINELAWEESSHGDFLYGRKKLAAHAGGEQLGASLYRLLSGKKAFPFHAHYANEETIFVLSGNGLLRLGDKSIDIIEGDYIALPKGGDHAHQVINTSENDLIYLCISTMIEPEVMEYPDSGKVGFMTGSAPGENKNDKCQKSFFRVDSAVSYYDGE